MMSPWSHRRAECQGYSSDSAWIEQNSVQTTPQPPSAFIPRKRACVPGRSEPYPVQWDVCQKRLRLTFGPKPIGSRRMSCLGFRAIKPTSAGMLCRPWVLELIQYLLTSGAFIAGRCQLSEAQHGHLMVDHEMDVRLVAVRGRGLERLVTPNVGLDELSEFEQRLPPRHLLQLVGGLNASRAHGLILHDRQSETPEQRTKSDLRFALELQQQRHAVRTLLRTRRQEG